MKGQFWKINVWGWQCGQRSLRLLKQVLPSIWVLPVMAVPSNLPHLAGALSPRLLNAGSDNVRHATRQIPSEKTIRLPAVFSFHWPCA
jgi:hypothetical protein